MINQKTIHMSLSNDNFEYFVHGTDHDRAKTIIEEGILLSKGAERQDFSDGSGFYLGNDLKETFSAFSAPKQASPAHVTGPHQYFSKPRNIPTKIQPHTPPLKTFRLAFLY